MLTGFEVDIVLQAAQKLLSNPVLVDEMASELHIEPEDISSVSQRFGEIANEIADIVEDHFGGNSSVGDDAGVEVVKGEVVPPA